MNQHSKNTVTWTPETGWIDVGFGEYQDVHVNGIAFRYRIDTFTDGQQRGHVWLRLFGLGLPSTVFCASTPIGDPNVESIMEQYSRDRMLREVTILTRGRRR